MSKRIPDYYLQFNEDDLEELQSDPWNDDPVPANLLYKNENHDIDIAYRGSYTRKFRKRSYHIVFINPSSFYGAREIHLNAEYKDPSLMRNKLSLDFFHSLGVLSPNSTHINLHRNDSAKGVYLQLESVDSIFLNNRDLPTGPIYYAVNNNANFSLLHDEKLKKDLLSGYRRIIGDSQDDHHLLDFIKTINSVPFPYLSDEIRKQLNLDAFFRWLVGAVCTMNNDGFTHNYALYRNSKNGLFEIIPWDYDATWGRKVDGGIMHHHYVPPEGKISNHLCYLLLRVPDFRKQYQLILEEVLETKFTVQYMEKKISELHGQIRSSVLLDPYVNKNMSTFDEEPQFILEFIRKRREYLLQYLMNN